AKNGAHFVSVQNEFSLFHRDPENDGVLVECEARGLAISSLFPVSQRIAYGEIPPREEIAGRKSCRRGLGTKSVYGKESGNRGATNRIRGIAQSHGARPGLRLAAGPQTGGIGHRRREQARTDSGECESRELETDFRRPCSD